MHVLPQCNTFKCQFESFGLCCFGVKATVTHNRPEDSGLQNNRYKNIYSQTIWWDVISFFRLLVTQTHSDLTLRVKSYLPELGTPLIQSK